MAGLLESLSDNIVVDKSRCIFCGECVEKCTCDNLRFRASPCREACPLRMNCHGYVQAVARGQEEKGMGIVLESLPFPHILGRVCNAPCEAHCSRSRVDGQAVALRALKRYLADSVHPVDGGSGWARAQEAAWAPVGELPERVAIIGGGPAGVMAACYLRKRGYRVTLLDAAPRLGGMLSNYIPEFRLPPEVAAADLSIVERLGVEVRLGTSVNAAGLGDLAGEYQAVLVATGATRGKRLGVAGEDLPGVYGGMELLRSVRGSGPISVGQRVVVIGGGNTAIDAAQTAYRLGAREVRVVCLESRGEMPAFAWEVEDALEEGIEVENGWGPVGMVAEGGRLAGVELRRCVAVFDAEGHFAPRFDDGERRIIEANTVVVAIGQESDLGLLKGQGVEVRGSRIVVDPETLQTSREKLFAAGDAVSGPATVVEALAQGRKAAESIHRYLRGEPMSYGRRDVEAAQVEGEVDISGAVVRERVAPPRLRGAARASFAEIEGRLGLEQARAEAERCISCGEPFGKYRTCWSCLACEVECPEDAIQVRVPFLVS